MFLVYILLSTSVLRTAYTATIQNEYKTYKDHKLYKVEGDVQELQNLILRISTEFAEISYHNMRGSVAHFLIAPELAQIFEESVRLANLLANVEINDYSEIISLEKSGTRKGDGFSWTSYYDVDDIYKYLRNASKSHPDWTEVVVGGKSYEGRPILGLRINTPTQNKSDNKPVVFIESGIHAREWITPATTTYFINELLTSDNPEITSLRDQFDWHIFPTVNPDGYHYSMTWDRMWRKTRSRSSGSLCYGADPNRNWDYNWLKHGATNNPCNYQTYGGSKPFSEVETRTLSEYITSLENLLAYVAFHSDAQMLLVPYSDSEEHTDDNYDDLIQIGKTSLEYGKKVNGEEYGGPATAAEVLYKASGGSMDWVRAKLGTPIVYTYELRGTYFHWPPNRIHEQGDEVTQMLLGLFAEASNLGYY